MKRIDEQKVRALLAVGVWFTVLCIVCAALNQMGCVPDVFLYRW